MYCTNCGKPLLENHKYCAYCGEKQEGYRITNNDSTPSTFTPVQVQASKRKPIPAWRIVLGCLGLVLLLVGMASTIGLIGFLIWFFLLVPGFVIFICIYNSKTK